MRAGVAALSAALILAACTPGETKSDGTDRTRMAALRGDPIVANAASYGERLGQTVSNGHYQQPNQLNAGLVVWAPTITGEQARSRVVTLLSDLRSQGWTVSGSSCVVASGSPSWTIELGGYKTKDGVPNAVHVIARFDPSAASGIQVLLTAPFHSDTKAYFANGPAALPVGSTCLEKAAAPGQARNGTFPELG